MLGVLSVTPDRESSLKALTYRHGVGVTVYAGFVMMATHQGMEQKC